MDTISPQQQQSSMPKNDQKPHLLYRSIFYLCITIVIIIGLYVVNSFIFTSSKKFQAVFVTNGQVYFGHLNKHLGGKFIRLTNVFYLQVNKPLQAGTDTQATADNSDLSLIKLGKELHGPQDAMLINRDQILFIEDLKSDSQVVQAIKDYQGK